MATESADTARVTIEPPEPISVVDRESFDPVEDDAPEPIREPRNTCDTCGKRRQGNEDTCTAEQCGGSMVRPLVMSFLRYVQRLRENAKDVFSDAPEDAAEVFDEALRARREGRALTLTRDQAQLLLNAAQQYGTGLDYRIEEQLAAHKRAIRDALG